MPEDWITTLGMAGLTVLAAAGASTAIARLRRGAAKSAKRTERLATITAVLGSVGLGVYRAAVIHETWTPLETHVDGLLLLVALLGIVTIYLQFTGRLRGVDLFLLPTMAMLAAWGLCASWWTLRPFNTAQVWNTVHIVSVYVGAAAVAAAAAIGALYLYVRRQLKRRDNPAEAFRVLGSLTSLESLDAGVVRSATVGFVLMTVALITGVITEVSSVAPTALDPGWWYTPKVIGAVLAWAIYALLTHVRLASAFRGRRAAQLAITGFIVLLIVLAIAAALPGCRSTQTSGVLRIDSDTGAGINLEVRP